MMAKSSDKVALIAGITGQDGAYLARFLLGKGYVVHGTSRDAALARLDGLIALGICDKVALHSMSPADALSVPQVIESIAPDEIYNLSGQSSVSLSFTQPAETLAGIAVGTLNMLETLRRLRGQVRFYNAGSSECFGDTGPRDSERADGIPAEEPLRDCQGGSHLVSDQLPRGLRTLRLFGTSLQSRITPSAEPLRDPQGHRGSG